jgi:mRNA interferase MazF
MKAGDVVLAAPAQTDATRKIRPAVLLCSLPPFGDWLACGISTQTRHAVPDFDELLAPEHVD